MKTYIIYSTAKLIKSFHTSVTFRLRFAGMLSFMEILTGDKG